MERALNAHIVLAESEVLRLRSRGDDNAKSGKSGILDARKIYPIKLKDMSRWRPWTERVIRLAKMQSPELAAALTAALKACDAPEGTRMVRGFAEIGIRIGIGIGIGNASAQSWEWC